MNKVIVWLGAALALQAVIAGGLFATSWQQNNYNPTQLLLEFDASSIDKIEISSADEQVVINKTEEGWALPDLSSLPAVQSKVNDIINKLETATVNWPVATSKGSQERFDVAEDQYQRRIKLFAENELVSELLLGTSPSFRRVHVRRPSESKVFTVELNNYDFPDSANDWLDKHLMAVVEPSKLKGEDFTLEKKGEEWQFASVGPLLEAGAVQLDSEQATSLVNAFVNLRVNTVELLPETTETLEFTVMADDKTYVYHFHEYNDAYFVSRDDLESSFGISKFLYDKFAQTSFATLAKSDESDESSDSVNENGNEADEQVENSE